MEQLYEAGAQERGGRRLLRGRKIPLIVFSAVVGAAAVLYLALCGTAALSSTFFPNTSLNGVKIGGLTAAQASQKLEKELPGRTCDIYLNQKNGDPAATVTYSALGVKPSGDYDSMAQDALTRQRASGFFGGGAGYLKGLLGGTQMADDMTWDSAQLDTIVAKLSADLSHQPKATAYTLGEDCVLVTKAKDGQTVSESDLKNALNTVLTVTGSTSVTVPASTQPAQVLSAQEIHDAVASQMKNAGYDSKTKSITAEQTGAEFDVDQAQKLLDDAEPGEQVKIPATIQLPAVTAEQLKGVLFRDELGTATTHVGGTSARMGNVKLAATALSSFVLNSGDTFSYNGTVGQRTEDKGYQAAPAYVQGETVDEVGGGVCQPSSTLYLACLRSNLEIVERYAHRYVPAYIPKGMDATVSWGGPDYKFRNNTNYPIKITTSYSNGYLTMTLHGTKTDRTTVKMTNKVLSSTAWKTVQQDDPTLTAGKQQVKVTPYTGYKVVTYRNLYDAQGNLISSKQEATSNYKVRDKLVLVGTKAVPTAPASSSSGSSSETPSSPAAGTETNIPGDTGTTAPGTTTTPETEPTEETTPAA